MTIKDLSENVRIPRLGKIHLGTRHPEKGYPQKSDCFVFPKDHPDYSKLVALFGEHPKELRILIPVEDEEVWATQYYKAYSQTYGLVCKGDGEQALRMVDIKTGNLPSGKETQTVTMTEIPCAGRQCAAYKAKNCKETMNLRFMLPEVPGLGVWQIDTRSINSILNINSAAQVIKKTFGRITLVPLTLRLEPCEGKTEQGKKTTVFVLNLRTNVTLAQLANASREQAKALLLEAPDLENAFLQQVERDKDELWPQDESTGEITDPKPQPATASTPVVTPDNGITGITGTTYQPGNEFDIEIGFLQNSIKTLRWAEPLVRQYLAGKYQVDLKGSLETVLKRLSPEQLKDFQSEVASREALK